MPNPTPETAKGTLMTQLLEATLRFGGSDLHLAVGRPPTIRIKGDLKSLETQILTGDDTAALMRAITPPRCQQELQTKGSTDFGFAFQTAARFRVSAFKQQGHVGLVLRLIPSKLLSFEDIGLPPVVKNLLFKPRGLFLVTGPTGSGKTTTLATMIDFINRESDAHIITVEDPIEYVHPHKRSVVTQREIGVDVGSFEEALRRALRQDPDVILVGEMRDLETIQAAITAAETGHLVFGTLHTTGAAKTVDRIIDAFPTNQQEQVRVQLASSILAILSQALLAKADGSGRVAAYELLVMTSAISNLIRENKTFRINSAIQTGRKFGMTLLDDHLLELYQRGVINYETAIQTCQDAEEFQGKLKGQVAGAAPRPGGGA